jgi:hypothetical protein
VAEQIARFKPGENVPAQAAPADVLAGRFVRVTATKNARGSYVVQHTGAGLRAFGVAERDAVGNALDWRGQFNVVRRGAIARVTAGAAITAGANVESDATGRAITATTGVVLGVAMNTVAAAGDIVEVDLV